MATTIFEHRALSRQQLVAKFPREKCYSRRPNLSIRAEMAVPDAFAAVPGAFFTTRVQLYLLDSGDNDTFSYNLFTTNWSGVYRQNFEVSYRENYVNALHPNGKLMEDHTSTSQDQPDGVVFGGFAVHNSGDRNLPGVKYLPYQVLNKYNSLGGTSNADRTQTWIYPDDPDHPDGRWGSSVTGDWRIVMTIKQFGP